MTTRLTAKTQRAIKAYCAATCLEAFRMNVIDGEGASTIVMTGPATIKTTRQADAACDAGAELHDADCLPQDGNWVRQEEAIATATKLADDIGLPLTVIRTPETHGWHHSNTVSARLRKSTTMKAVTVLPATYFRA